jgi:hypothetical protein
MRELNLQALPQHREKSAASCNVLPAAADLVAPLRSQLYAKPRFRGHQNSLDGKHPNAMIKDFRALLNHTHDTTHCIAIFPGTWVFIKHMSHKKWNIPDEQLQAMEHCMYHGIKVHIEDLEG